MRNVKMVMAVAIAVIAGLCSTDARAAIASVAVEHTVRMDKQYPDVANGYVDKPDIHVGYNHPGTSPARLRSLATRFDLSTYAGQTVTGDGTITFYSRLYPGHTADPNGFQILNLNVDFVFAETTWNNRTTGNAWTENSSVYYNKGGLWDTSGQIGTFAVTEADYTLKTVTVPQATIQSWIDGNNHGIVVAPGNLNTYITYRCIDIAGFGNSGSLDIPTLGFSYVPEPATMGLLLLGLGLRVLTVRRRKIK